MKLEYIEWKNFASYGNKMQRIVFTEEEAELFLTLGKNGDGKTTIANAIIFALYGKVEGIKLGDLPNRINKELLVRIKLRCGGTTVEIERGLAPGVFDVLLNGIKYDKAGKRSVQDYLEEEIYGIPFHVFKNIIILSVNDFKSFLTMTNHDKKQIIDKMFGFSILNDMQNKVKDDRKFLKQDIESYERELIQINENMVSVNMKLNTLLAESDEQDKIKVSELKDSIIELNTQQTRVSEALRTIINVSNDKQTALNDRVRKVSGIEHGVEILNNKIKLYDSNLCPTCESKLSGDFHNDRKLQLTTKLDEYPTLLESAKHDVSEIKDEIKKLQSKEVLVRERHTLLKSNIDKIKSELLSIKNSVKGKDNFVHLKEIISEFEEKEALKNADKNKMNADYNFLEIVEDILGEDGVKNLAVRTILPGLNSNIAAMAQTMHLHFHIRFDDKFNCIINHLGEDINPLTLSTGERKKADFIIIIAIIKILKLRFPELNLLFLDELLSSVDSDGVYNILKILNQVIKESKINTFVINHATLPHELFDKTIQIYRENGFSRIKTESIE